MPCSEEHQAIVAQLLVCELFSVDLRLRHQTDEIIAGPNAPFECQTEAIPVDLLERVLRRLQRRTQHEFRIVRRRKHIVPQIHVVPVCTRDSHNRSNDHQGQLRGNIDRKVAFALGHHLVHDFDRDVSDQFFQLVGRRKRKFLCKSLPQSRMRCAIHRRQARTFACQPQSFRVYRIFEIRMRRQHISVFLYAEKAIIARVDLLRMSVFCNRPKPAT